MQIGDRNLKGGAGKKEEEKEEEEEEGEGRGEVKVKVEMREAGREEGIGNRRGGQRMRSMHSKKRKRITISFIHFCSPPITSRKVSSYKKKREVVCLYNLVECRL